ncbi:putative Serine-threonine protein kinase [Monocercomonoides exilis]|uniref:putative Serine-threonine protein kinase n=1 Tax=Monocercomonoides exilis TaxID=2049356 RepID=UPI00355A94E1|nr:putative Serine-threonine protein kinase [Monocercomonoides exilis]|eukprot:MONOS_11231.1-p1 / transcript=MONOS_11231.1 / gene=MONOS_11231 / organism=Monocercomonoides_exilis_PA203 / gene_product=Serine-threonine protein kinase / transcript_product=Serine-threonine protein kinase / location=Mono_scaffold00552:40253-43614(-) / protein_length=477 / sequence_SO=supercontig / SO=protein_coding / is_pseudo=false
MQHSKWGSISTFKKATLFLPRLYRHIDPSFKYIPQMKNYRNALTSPFQRALNRGLDNEEGNFVFRVGDIIYDTEQAIDGTSKRYLVEGSLGQGSYGQVLKCVDMETFCCYAIKVIKNIPAYTRQAQYEKKILSLIREKDFDDQRRCLRLVNDFVFHGHACFVTEILGENLYTTLKRGHFQGFSLSLVSVIIAQVLDVMCLLRSLKIIHADLKPENILIDGSLPKVKVVDFGSAVFESHPLYTYIQSRYYRAPEVLLGLPYSLSIDMWSVGCIAAELFLGHPLLPGQPEHDQLCRIQRIVGNIPSELAVKSASFQKYFIDDAASAEGVRLMNYEEYIASQQTAKLFNPSSSSTSSTPSKPPRRYPYEGNTLEDTIEMHHRRTTQQGNLLSKSANQRHCFIHFIRSILMIDARKRPSPFEMLQHPFITRQPWKGEWAPRTPKTMKEMKEMKEMKMQKSMNAMNMSNMSNVASMSNLIQ